MSSRLCPGHPGPLLVFSTMRTLYAADVASFGTAPSRRNGLPRDGFASAWGFWFADEGWTEIPPLRLEIRPPATSRSETRDEDWPRTVRLCPHREREARLLL